MTAASPAPSAPEDRLALIARLGALIDEGLAGLCDPAGGETCALVDFPDHGNVGDSAIWTGEIAWARRRLRRMPGYVAGQDVEWDRLGRVAAAGTVLVHGGGNFGDLWPAHQEFRLALLERFRGRPVVQLPQSIHFADEAAIDRTARAIAAHGAFTLLVRDRESLALALARFDCDVRLCPDMAFCLGPQERPAPPVRDVLLLLREDREAAGAPIEMDLPEGWLRTDWLDDGPGFETAVRRRTRLRKLLHGELPLITNARNQGHHFDVRAEHRLARGLALLGGARTIVTDRLHVHILSTLMGIPHVILDNSYGKIGRFASTFGSAWGGVAAAATLPEALDHARRLLAAGEASPRGREPPEAEAAGAARDRPSRGVAAPHP